LGSIEIEMPYLWARTRSNRLQRWRLDRADSRPIVEVPNRHSLAVLIVAHVIAWSIRTTKLPKRAWSVIRKRGRTR
jgi:hypothetical protein